jgi:hypothetical protein
LRRTAWSLGGIKGESMNRIAELRSKNGTATSVGYDFSSSLEELVQRGDVDCYIVSTEDGFSPLGASRQFFSNELGIVEADIRRLADWNRFNNPDISLVCLPSQRPTSNLKGVVLAASETSKCYEQFAPAFHSRPYRDFYYNVAYESIAYSAKVLGAEKIAMSHLSGSGHFHKDIATCVAEALAHFCDIDDNPNIFSFLFVGCCIDPNDLSGIQCLNLEGDVTKHRNIRIQTKQRNGYDVISFDWR